MIPRHLQIAGALVLLALLAAAIYGVQLRRRDERNRRHAAVVAPLTAETSGHVQFPALVAYDDDGVLTRRQLSAALPSERSERARVVLRTLLLHYMQNPSPHPVAAGSDVRAVYLTPDGLCVVDLNATFADAHRSGMLVEHFTLLSMLETVALNTPGVRRVKFLVDGKERPSLAGHADLATIYDVEAVRAAVKEYERR